MKWARNHLSYINQVLALGDEAHALIDSSLTNINIDEWDTPSPPDITFYSNPRQSNIPKSIMGTNKNNNTSLQNKIQADNDNQTVATVHTAWSSASHNDISDLQTDSRNQLSITHESRMKQLEQLLHTNIQDIKHQYNTIENRLQHIEQSNSFLHEEMNSILVTLPQLTEKVASHQSQLLHTLNDNSEFCKLTTTIMKDVQNNQQISNDWMTKLEDVVFKLIHQTTPNSSGRTRKKQKSRSREIIFSNKSSDNSDMSLPTTQLDMLIDTNTSTMTEILNNTNTSFDIPNSQHQSLQDTSHMEGDSQEVNNQDTNTNVLGQDPDHST